MMALGTSAPNFKLPDVLGSPISLEHYVDPAAAYRFYV